MDERTGSVRLVDAHTAGQTLVATIARDEVEKALQSDEPVDLMLDVERVAPDGDGRETERIALGWEPADIERLLQQAQGEEITLTFDEAELRKLLEADVEAHGMRESLAVLTVVAGLAAASAGSAAAGVYTGQGQEQGSTPSAAVTHVTSSEISAGLTAATAAPASEVSAGVGVGAPTPAAPATPSEVSTGITATPAAAPSEVSTGIVQEPAPSAPEVTTGIVSEPTATPASNDPSWTSPSPEALAIAAGTILAITALGFAARTQRTRPRPV